MRSDRLSGADLSALAFEGPETPMHVMAILWLEAAPLRETDGRLALGAIRQYIQERLDRAPRLRQTVDGNAIFGAVWRDTSPVDLSRHVVEVSLPPPGTESQLLELAARVFMERLDLARPLWQLLLVTGLADGHVVAFMKVHHAIADGPAAVRLLSSLFDVSPETPTPSSPLRAPSRGKPPRDVLSAIRSLGSALSALAPAPRTSLNRPVGLGRRLAIVRLELTEVKQVAHAHGGKVNDVVLALAAQGARAILEHRDERVAAGKLYVSVFVGLRKEREELGNATGVMRVPLPVDGRDGALALELISEASSGAKRQRPAAGMAAVTFFITRARLGRALYRHQRQVNIFATNVVGPTAPVHALGAGVDDVAVVTPLGGNVALTFAALSYAGRLNITVIGDADGCPEVDLAATAMRTAWSGLRQPLLTE